MLSATVGKWELWDNALSQNASLHSYTEYPNSTYNNSSMGATLILMEIDAKNIFYNL